MILYDKKEAGVRLSQLISDSGLNSRQFALSIDGDPSYLAKMEKGDKGISKTYLEKLEQKYRINREWLLYGTGEMYLNGQKVPYGTLANVSGANFRDQLRDKKNTTHPFLVPLVPVKAQAGYAKNLYDMAYIEKLDTYPIVPGIDHHGAIWRYFQVSGKSMEDTFKEGQFLLTSQVLKEDWKNIENFYVYVIVTNEGVMIKRIAKVKGKDYWAAISDNDAEFQQFKLPVSEVKELWKYRRHIEWDASPPKKFEIKV